MTQVDAGRDTWVAAAGALVAALGLVAALLPPSAPPPSGTAFASVGRAVGELRRRPAAALGWQRVYHGAQLSEGDALFVAPGGEALLRFEDGTELVVDERSLVVVERPREGQHTLSLQQGALTGRAGAGGVAIATPTGVASLGSASEARVIFADGGAEVAVSKGSARVAALEGHAQGVAAGQRVELRRGAVAALPAWPITLTAPSAQWARTYAGTPPPVELTWTPEPPKGARLQLAGDRLFAFVAQDVEVNGTRFTVERPVAGVSWWRLVGSGGEPLSEARRFALVEDVAPLALTPREGEVVLAPPGAEVVFSWTALKGVTRYRLELASSEDFAEPQRTHEAPFTDAKLTLNLPEGTWYYRVRAADGEQPGAPSLARRFRLIHRGIPEAPELYTPQLEVSP